jgi:cytochrome c biogenesis protein
VSFANRLIGALAGAGAFGIVIRQFRAVAFTTPDAYAAELAVNRARYGEPWSSIFERLGLYHVFTTWWFSALVVLFSLSVAGNTLGRIGSIWADVRRPPVKRGRRFFSPLLPGRIEPLEGISYESIGDLLRKRGYRVRVVEEPGIRHLLAERWPLAPFGSPIAHGALLLFVLAMGLIIPRLGFEEGLKVPVGAERPVGAPGTPGNLLVRNEEFVATYDERRRPTEFLTRLVVFRDGVEVVRKDVLVNDPLSVDGTVFHENFFGPAVEIDVRDAGGRILFSGPVVLDGMAGGLPEGAQALPGSDVTLELLLRRGVGGVAQLDVVGLRPAPPNAADAPPTVVFSARLTTGQGYAPDALPIAIEFRRPSSYIGLIVKRDPGQGLVWLGGILLVAGLTLSLAFPRRRIWMRWDGARLRLAAQGGGPFGLAEFERLVAALADAASADRAVETATAPS